MQEKISLALFLLFLIAILCIPNFAAEKQYKIAVVQAYDSVSPGVSSINGTVFYAKDNKIIINIGSNDGVKVGMVFMVNHVIEVVKDPYTGEVVDEITEPVAEITVVEVKERSSTCNITKGNNKNKISIKDKVKQKIGKVLYKLR